MTKRKAKGIRRERKNGRWVWVADCTDSEGHRTRPSFDTKPEAIAEKARIEAWKSGGTAFIAKGAATKFSTLLDKLVDYKRDTGGVQKGALDATTSTANVFKAAFFGGWNVNDFAGEKKWESVQQWFTDQAKPPHNKRKGTLQNYRSVFSTAFKLARKGTQRLIRFNPVTEYGLEIPGIAEQGEGKVLMLEDADALIRGALEKKIEDRSELTYRTRGMFALIAFFTGMRPEEIVGLCWDCVRTDLREIYVERSVRERDIVDEEGKKHAIYEIVDDLKTKHAERTIPMSPVLVPAFEAHRAYMREIGKPVEGRHPVLVGKNARLGNFITTNTICGNHWPVLALKAGFIGWSSRKSEADLSDRYTAYDLRHTFATTCLQIGMREHDVKDLMGHEDYNTTAENYIHRTPRLFIDVRQAVEQAIRELELEKTPEGFIDALGFVTARRLKDQGIDIKCADPRPKPSQVGFDPMRALPGPVIEAQPTVEVTKSPVIINQTTEELRLYRFARTKELWGQGWAKTRIAAELHTSLGTIGQYLRDADILHTRGRLPADERADLQERFDQYRAKHPKAGVTQIAKAIGTHTGRVSKMARDSGKAVPRVMPDYKLGQHHEEIVRGIAERRSFRKMAKEFGVSFSALALYAKRHGLKGLEFGANQFEFRADQFDADIIRLHGEGKDGKQIAEELHTISHSAVCRRINDLGLNTESERKQNAARARAKKALQRKQLALDLGTKLAPPALPAPKKPRKSERSALSCFRVIGSAHK